MKPKERLVFFISLVTIVFFIWIVFQKNYGNTTFYDFEDSIREDYPVLGVDVSHYQGNIDWQELSGMRKDEDSIQFVFIKATEGVSVIDDKKRYNAFGARSVEIDYGFYHFFIPTVSAARQADFFCQAIRGYNFDLKPVLDVEADHNFSAPRFRDSIIVFLDQVEKKLEVRPVIYTYANYFKRYFTRTQELFWVAKYSKECSLMELEKVFCWQFSESGSVDGIEERVDLNVAKENFFEKSKR